MRRGYTLVELIISMALFASMMMGVLIAVTSSGSSIQRDIAGAKLMTEMNYAIDTARTYSAPASKVLETSRLPAAGGERADLYFRRESDVSKVTPADLSDDIWYRIYKNAANDIVLRNVSTQKEEVLVSSIFSPRVVFSRAQGFEPNFFIVTFSGEAGPQGKKTSFSKTAGIRLWYAEVVQ